MVMCDAANYLGFSTLCLKGNTDFLLENHPFPCILHWSGKHFVVLYKIGKNILGRRVYRIADPATGLIKLSEGKFKRHWMNDQEHGIMMILTPTDAFYKKADDELEDDYHAFSALRPTTPDLYYKEGNEYKKYGTDSSAERIDYYVEMLVEDYDIIVKGANARSNGNQKKNVSH